jgi:hypothetical protein
VNGLESSLRRAARDVSCHYRLRGTVANLEALARSGVTLTPDDHRLHQMAWLATHVLDLSLRRPDRPSSLPPVPTH